ncbi:C40 family peptidase [Streptosporangium sp. NPDC000396]|uniref:C40 family peptidase n=1 Tax=Streptosporangium sp. NPDC000396 TaxID=3366185 RepID=UPI0036C24CF1
MITTLITATILATTFAGLSQASPSRSCLSAIDDWMRSLSEVEMPRHIRRRLEGEIRAALAVVCAAEPVRHPEPGAHADAETSPSGNGDANPWTARIGAERGFSDAGEAGSWVAMTDIKTTPIGIKTAPSGAEGTRATGDTAFHGADDGPFPDAGDLWAVSATEVPGADDGRFPGAGDLRTAGAADSSGLPSSSSSPFRVHQPAVIPSAKPEAPPAKPEAPRSSSVLSRQPRRLSPGQTAVAAALRQIGRPYVWGGGSSTGPTGGGFDCSGLTLHAWAKAGAKLSHYTGSQFRQGRRVPLSQLRPGDLVFFGGGTADPAHVGIYVKDGVMVHAPKTGDVVKTTNFAHSAYYRARYRGAVRPLP